jgi:hypothetical protein
MISHVQHPVSASALISIAINLYLVAAKIGLKFKPHLFRLYLDRI